jgi:integrase
MQTKKGKTATHADGMGRLQAVLTDPKVRDWYEERSLRSRLSADTYARQLHAISERLEMTPEDVVLLAKKNPNKLRSMLTHCASAMQGEGKLDSYVSKWFESLKSYLRFRHVNADVFPRISKLKGGSLSKERVPTPEELGRVLEHLSLRGRTIALFMAHSGLRPGVIGSYGGENGLRLQDLPDLKLGAKPVFAEVPFVVRVPAALSKTRTAYTSFGSSQLSSTLLAYLEDRIRGGEELTPSSPVIAASPVRGIAKTLRENSHGFVSTKTVVLDIREALQATVPEGVTWRPYVLRSYCSTRLTLAEGSGKMTRDLREAILGHDGGISARYNVGKPWGAELLKEARAQYKRAESYLSTTGGTTDSQADATRIIKLFLVARGIPAEKLDKLDIGAMSDEEVVGLVKKLGASAGPSKEVEKAVPVEEVPRLLAAGWRYVAQLNGSMAVLRGPGA